MTQVTLALTGDQHQHLKSFLFPGDGNESVAILLCGHRLGDRRRRLTVREIHGVPDSECPVRTPLNVTWRPDYIVPILDRADTENLAVVKVHSHPGGYPKFSETDDAGDIRLLPMIRGWTERALPHGSAVMLPGGEMFGRVLGASGAFEPIDCISVAGDTLHFWYADKGQGPLPDFLASHAQAFDQGTIDRLRRLTVTVVGASGTGSPVIEMLIRLGVGVIIIVDDDKMEDRNVNRIINSIMEDAKAERYKVDVIGDAVERIGLGTTVIRHTKNLWDPEVIRSVAQSDILIGCMDTVDGRFLLNKLATYYNMPYFDVGIRLDTHRTGARKGTIREACGTINYLQPGRSSLLSRGLFTMTDVAAAGLRRTDPAAHAQQVADGYIKGGQNHRPAVISINMLGASILVNELLARLHPYREEPNGRYASVTFSLASMELIPEPEEGICDILGGQVGKGDATPLLNLIELTESPK